MITFFLGGENEIKNEKEVNNFDTTTNEIIHAMTWISHTWI
jgi:hypothetical protein